jgi:hypothetical protein
MGTVAKGRNSVVASKSLCHDRDKKPSIATMTRLGIAALLVARMVAGKGGKIATCLSARPSWKHYESTGAGVSRSSTCFPLVYVVCQRRSRFPIRLSGSHVARLRVVLVSTNALRHTRCVTAGQPIC